MFIFLGIKSIANFCKTNFLYYHYLSPDIPIEILTNL